MSASKISAQVVEQAAQHLSDRMKREGSLYQPDAAADLVARFGSQVLDGEHGGTSIHPKIRKRLQELAPSEFLRSDGVWVLKT